MNNNKRDKVKAPMVLQRGQQLPQASNERSRNDRNMSNNGQQRNQPSNGGESSYGNSNDNRRHNAGGSSSNSNSNSNSAKGVRTRDSESYGVIAAIKSNFGFIQPFVGDEQLYFSDRDFYDNMKIGDKVGYFPRQANKGQQAEGVRFLRPHLEQFIPSAKATVVRVPDPRRNLMGLLEIDLTSLKPEACGNFERMKEIPYRQNDVIESSIPKHHRMDKGDTVEISISKVHDSQLMFACNVKLLQLDKDRMLAVQIQRLLDAGAVREQGVISAKKGDYGFIKALDRKDEVYFRMDDVIEDENSKLTEGSEVEFFVIVEMVKGKLSDRATLLKQLPKGSVKFELQLASRVLATVIEENVNYPSEAPGKLKLHVPVSIANVPGNSKSDTIDVVELWQRCLPDELVCRVGDELYIDVQYYRPEKLYFARSVKVSSFRKIGREFGTICSVKDHAFGFISSQLRGVDMYFKTTHVIGVKGDIVPESSLKVDMDVSFDVILEETNNGSRVRAQRVRVEGEESKEAIALIRKQVIKKDLIGVVLRNASKNNAPGYIKVHPNFMNDYKTLEYVNTDLIDRLTYFQNSSVLSKVSLYGLPTQVQRDYCQIIEKRFPGIAYEIGILNQRDGSVCKVFTIMKLNSLDYQQWFTNNVAGGRSSSTASPVPNSASKERADAVLFSREDYESLCFGPLANDLKVVFDLCWDSNKNKKVARSIRLTDEPALDAPDKLFGIMEVVVEKEKDEPYGFLRCMQTDEKLFWHCSETFLPYGQDLRVGTDVSFIIRRRGGMRCAIDIEVLSVNANSKEEVLPELCTGVVVEEGLVVLTDVAASPILNTKLADITLLHNLNVSKIDKSPVTWEKLGLIKQIPDEAFGVSQGGSTDTPPPTSIVSESDVVVEVISPTPVSVARSNANTPIETSADDFEFNVDYKPKYFNCIPRSAIAIKLVAGENGSGKKAAIGDVVTCQAVMNLGITRSPLSVVNVNSTGKVAVKRKGRLNRMKFRVKPISGSEAAFANYGLGLSEFVEIVAEAKPESEVNSEVEGSYSGLYYYCDYRELKISNDSRDLIQNGDEVEFWTTATTGNVALHVVPVPKAAFKEINFKRGAINAELKDVKMKTGSVNLITMAQGPPNDSSTGFEAGWRVTPQVNTLPWGHLLAHLNA